MITNIATQKWKSMIAVYITTSDGSVYVWYDYPGYPEDKETKTWSKLPSLPDSAHDVPSPVCLYEVKQPGSLRV